MGPYDMYGNLQMPHVYGDTVRAVDGMAGAKSLQLKPGASVIVPDSSEKLMYFVSANQFGIKTITAYPYGDPITSNTEQAQQSTVSNDTPVYVQQSEFDGLKSQVSEMQSQLSKLVEELK